MSETQREFFAVAAQLMSATQGLDIQSNSKGGVVFRLPDIDGSGRYSNSGPVLLIGAGNTRAVAGPLDPLGRSTGVYGQISGAKGLPGGRASGAIPGSGGRYHIGHLWPRGDQGPGDIPGFKGPELDATNGGGMRVLEQYLRQIAAGGVPGVPAQLVTYVKIPLYNGNNAIPDYYLVIAWGSKGWNLPPIYIQNF